MFKRSLCLIALLVFLFLVLFPSLVFAFGNNNLNATIMGKNIVANFNGAGKVEITASINVDSYANLDTGENYVTKTGNINLFRIPYAAYSPGNGFSVAPGFDSSKATIVYTWQIQNYTEGTYALQYTDKPTVIGQYIYYACGTDTVWGTFSQVVNVDVLYSDNPNSPANTGTDNNTKNATNMNNTNFTDGWWNICMQWYDTLVTLSGAFIFIVIIRSGYRYYQSSIDPSARASLLMDVQRCLIAMFLIIITPFVLYMLIQANNGLVSLFYNITVNIQHQAQVSFNNPTMTSVDDFFSKIVASPFQAIVGIFNSVFGLKNLDVLIFNINTSNSTTTGVLPASIFGNIQIPNNVFASALLNLCMVGFNAYFNALYSIRYWVITAAFIGTPIIVWIWAFTEERQVLEIWGSEIFSTVFMQTFHALTFGAFFSVMVASQSSNTAISLFVDTTKSVTSTTAAGNAISNMGLWFAGLGGAFCALALLSASIKLIVSRGQDKSVAESKESVSKAIIGLTVLGLSAMIAGFLVYLFNGNW